MMVDTERANVLGVLCHAATIWRECDSRAVRRGHHERSGHQFANSRSLLRRRTRSANSCAVSDILCCGTSRIGSMSRSTS